MSDGASCVALLLGCQITKNYDTRTVTSVKPTQESRNVLFCPFCFGRLWRKAYMIVVVELMLNVLRCHLTY